MFEGQCFCTIVFEVVGSSELAGTTPLFLGMTAAGALRENSVSGKNGVKKLLPHPIVVLIDQLDQLAEIWFAFGSPV